MLNDSKKNLLPLSAQVIADVIGKKAALVLSSKCKHRCLYIPKGAVTDTHPIVRTIGRDLTSLLQKEFGGELLTIARCKGISITKRDAEIRVAWLSGNTQEEIARQFSLSMKQVERILRPELAARNRQRLHDKRLKRCMAERQEIKFHDVNTNSQGGYGSFRGGRGAGGQSSPRYS